MFIRNSDVWTVLIRTKRRGGIAAVWPKPLTEDELMQKIERDIRLQQLAEEEEVVVDFLVKIAPVRI